MRNTAAIHCRRMLMSDVTSVVHIEKQQHPIPWSIDMLSTSLAQHDWAWVVDDALRARVVAYALVRQAGIHADILTLATHPDYLRQGIATHLIKHMQSQLTQANITELFLEVRCSNQAAQSLYRRCAFEQVGMRKQYYCCPHLLSQKEDAIVMRCFLPVISI